MNAGALVGPQIMGGRLAEPGEIPYQVSY